MRVLTWDIGGANIKRLLLDSDTASLKSDVFYFPLWQRKAELEDFLRKKNLKADHVGVTMTAELCDVFTTKDEGVEYVIRTCENVFSAPLYLTIDGRLCSRDEIRDYLILAASNWVASVKYLKKKYGQGVLLDVGSTTTDIIPFGFSRIEDYFREISDLERLRRGFLVYTGFLRTPVSAIVRKVPLGGELTRISSETFAIAADVYNVLGLLDSYICATPDGGGKAPSDSMRRLARILCADLQEVGEKEVKDICTYLYRKQAAQIAEALASVLRDHHIGKPRVYVCGSGIPLGMRACEIAGLPAVNLREITGAYDNLPCLGMAEMLIGKV